MPYDVPEDDEEKDGGSDPVATIARYLNPDRAQGDDDSGMGGLFRRVASGPRIKPPMAPAGDDETMRFGEPSASGPLPQPVNAPASGDNALGKTDAPRSLGDFAAATGTGNPAPFSPDIEGDPNANATPGADDKQQSLASAFGDLPSTSNATPAAPAAPGAQPTHLSQVPDATQPPTMSPEFGQTQADLRAKSNVTPKIDPTTGKTLDKYKIGVGGRIARALKDFGLGMATGHGLVRSTGDVLKGAFGDRDAPGYFGKGAVSSQYGRDEKQRLRDVDADKAKIGSFEDEQKQSQQEWTDSNKVRQDELKRAFEQDTGDIRRKAGEEKEQNDKTIADLKQQAQDLKEQLRDISYDAGSKQFMHEGTIYTPKNVEEGAVLEVQHGIQNGPYRQMWDKERRNQRLQVHTGDKDFSARDKLKIKAYAKSNGIRLKSTTPEDISDAMTMQQVDEALGNKYVDPGDSMLRGDALKNFNNDSDVKNIDEEMKKLTEDRSMYVQGTGSTDPNIKKQSEEGLAGIDIRVKELTNRRNAVRDRFVQEQNKRQEKTPANQPAGAKPAAAAPAAKPAQNASQLKPIPDKSVKMPSGRVYNIGDKVKDPNDNQVKPIKGFSQDEKGKYHVTF
jgi:hypothetical protein